MSSSTSLTLLKWCAGGAVSLAAVVALVTPSSSKQTLSAQQQNSRQNLSDPTAIARNKQLVRRHSSGDFAWIPTPADMAKKKAAQKNFGVPEGAIHDSEGSQLPTTRGY